MTTKFLKKSVRLLALLACTSIYNEGSASTLTGDDGGAYATTGALAPRIPTITLVASGGGISPSGTWTLDAQGPKNIVAQGAATYITHTGTVTATAGAELNLFGYSAIQFSQATMNGPTTGTATINLFSSGAERSNATGAYTRCFTLPASLSGNWMIVSKNDAAAIDCGDAAVNASAMPSFTMNVSRSAYFGGIRGITASSYAATFGGSSSAVVTGPGTLKLGTAFTTFNPVYTKFTGALETNNSSALALGTTSYPASLGSNTLTLNGAGAVILGGTKPVVKKIVASVSGGGVVSAASGAVVAITELDLTQAPITLQGVGGLVTYNIGKITEGSDQPLTLNSAAASLVVNIKAGRTDGGVVRSGSGSITLTTP